MSELRVRRGQVAQVVERSPEKAGVGGSTPSLATIFLHLALPIPPAGSIWFQLISVLQLTLQLKLLSLPENVK